MRATTKERTTHFQFKHKALCTVLRTSQLELCFEGALNVSVRTSAVRAPCVYECSPCRHFSCRALPCAAAAVPLRSFSRGQVESVHFIDHQKTDSSNFVSCF